MTARLWLMVVTNKVPTRAEAIRRLIELGLEATAKPKPKGPAR